MSIRKWFGCNVKYNQSSSVARALDELLDLYANATMRYLEFPQAQSIYDLLDRISRKDLGIKQRKFLEWMQDKAIPYFNNVLLQNELIDNVFLVKQFEYVKFILEDEMENSSFSDSIRSCLVDIVSFMPERIENALSIVNDEIEFKRLYPLNVPAENYNKNTEESAHEQAFLMII